ncbi:hypothetical protein EVAR_54336_1 [Eumeta japonica]|uniref:Uncharacterized protein n=1 Tax=Eumeta variegata TaxID=151549 RepID=A0A4C1Y7M6_EUMVA|nr:hypothetical protein EVAR_54336_1 [Eumeta japonica]
MLLARHDTPRHVRVLRRPPAVGAGAAGGGNERARRGLSNKTLYTNKVMELNGVLIQRVEFGRWTSSGLLRLIELRRRSSAGRGGRGGSSGAGRAGGGGGYEGAIEVRELATHNSNKRSARLQARTRLGSRFGVTRPTLINASSRLIAAVLTGWPRGTLRRSIYPSACLRSRGKRACKLPKSRWSLPPMDTRHVCQKSYQGVASFLSKNRIFDEMGR